MTVALVLIACSSVCVGVAVVMGARADCVPTESRSARLWIPLAVAAVIGLFSFEAASRIVEDGDRPTIQFVFGLLTLIIGSGISIYGNVIIIRANHHTMMPFFRRPPQRSPSGETLAVLGAIVAILGALGPVENIIGFGWAVLLYIAVTGVPNGAIQAIHNQHIKTAHS